jgi:plastocyanin
MQLIKILMFVVLGITISLLTQQAHAQIVSNNAFSLEGAGFAVTEDSLQTSQLDLFLSTTTKTTRDTNFVVDDGIITLNNEDFIATDLSGTILRDGRFIRLQGTVENPSGDEISLQFFGRLIEKSTQGSVYGFTGSLTQDGSSSKIIYTTKVSTFEKVTKTTQTTKPTNVIIHILKGSSDPSSVTYKDKLGQAYTTFNYYSNSRISIIPGTTITFVNDDIVSHSVTSGSGLGQNSRYTEAAASGKQFACEGDTSKIRDSGYSYIQKNCIFMIDGRIKSGSIQPGGQWSVTINEMGFYRLVDLDYPWMELVIYAFPQSNSITIGTPDPDDARQN